MLSPELLKILVCPKDHGSLKYAAEQNTLTCETCGHVYRVQNDIPIMLPDDESAAP